MRLPTPFKSLSLRLVQNEDFNVNDRIHFILTCLVWYLLIFRVDSNYFSLKCRSLHESSYIYCAGPSSTLNFESQGGPRAEKFLPPLYCAQGIYAEADRPTSHK